MINFCRFVTGGRRFPPAIWNGLMATTDLLDTI
jgi:hypothetical protein